MAKWERRYYLDNAPDYIDEEDIQYQTGVHEILTPYCPNCGAKMNIEAVDEYDWRDEED